YFTNSNLPSGQNENRPAASDEVTVSCCRGGEKLLVGTYPAFGLGDPPGKSVIRFPTCVLSKISNRFLKDGKQVFSGYMNNSPSRPKVTYDADENFIYKHPDTDKQ
ncbi:jg23733, partial [Pararge aegeria aegeria]